MKNLTESNLSLVPSSLTCNLIPSRINSDFIQNVIEQSIPTHIWQTFEAVETANGFVGFDIAMQQQNLHLFIKCTVKPRRLGRGYKVLEQIKLLLYSLHIY